MNSFFSTHLMDWHRLENDRQMPWKGEKDPYKIWLSEVILQQTRVEQGWAYYEKFVAAFPTIHDLAAAPEARVFKFWEGLGYYSRCRNLIATARKVAHDLHGEFPSDLESLLTLKGVGAYTAAAIASFAFDLPHAVVDGNVVRVLSRFLGHAVPVDGLEGRKLFSRLAQELLDKQDPAAWNQAIMDLGATICKPQSPHCDECPLQKRCIAYQQGRIAELPVKTPKVARRKRFFYYMVVERRGRWLIRERTGRDIWRHLHEFPSIERQAPMTVHAVWKEIRGMDSEQPARIPEGAVSGPFRQLLTHQVVEATFVRVKAGASFEVPEGYRWVTRKAMSELAFPRLIVSFLAENG